MIFACCITAIVLVASFAAEVLHARRIARISHLVAGQGYRLSALARAAPAIRMLGVGGLTWGIATLLTLPAQRFEYGSDETPAVDKNTLKRVVLLVDVSPSMNIKDADHRTQSRSDRAAAVVLDVLSRFACDRSRLSVLAFYTEVKPIVIDTTDPNVVRYVMWNNSIVQAFPDGETDLAAAVTGAFDVVKDWRPGSTTLLILTDGDSASNAWLGRVPPSIEHVVIAGVGDPVQGTEIDDHLSRQDGGNLQQLAARLNGAYFDANDHLLPTDLLTDSIGPMTGREAPAPPLRVAAIIAVVVSSVGLLGLQIALAYFGRVAVRGSRPDRQMAMVATGAAS